MIAPAHRPRRVGLADLAYRRIKRDIVRCQLRPGEDVSEAGLASHYMLGKAPIRAAIQRLAQDGLALPVPRRGHQIAPITMKWVEDTFDVRVVLEQEAARRAAGHVPGDHLRALDAVLQAGYDVGDSRSTERYLRTNTELHVAVAKASGNEQLARALARLLDDMERIFHFALKFPDRNLGIRHDHRDMIGALIAGDGDVAAKITGEQVLVAERIVTQALRSSAQMMSMRLEFPRLRAARATETD